YGTDGVRLVVPGKAVHRHGTALIRGVDELPISDVHADVGCALVKDDQISRLKVLQRNLGQALPLGLRGAGDSYPGLLPGSLCQARAIPGVRASATVYVAIPYLSLNKTNSLIGLVRSSRLSGRGRLRRGLFLGYLRSGLSSSSGLVGLSRGLGQSCPVSTYRPGFVALHR